MIFDHCISFQRASIRTRARFTIWFRLLSKSFPPPSCIYNLINMWSVLLNFPLFSFRPFEVALQVHQRFSFEIQRALPLILSSRDAYGPAGLQGQRRRKEEQATLYRLFSSTLKKSRGPDLPTWKLVYQKSIAILWSFLDKWSECGRWGKISHVDCSVASLRPSKGRLI